MTDSWTSAVMGGSFSGDVYENALFENPGRGNRWLTLRLVGSRANRDAIAARVTVTVEENARERRIFATVGSGGSFGGSSLQQEIGLGQATRIKALEVLSPGTGPAHRYRLADQRRYLLTDSHRRLSISVVPGASVCTRHLGLLEASFLYE